MDMRHWIDAITTLAEAKATPAEQYGRTNLRRWMQLCETVDVVEQLNRILLRYGGQGANIVPNDPDLPKIIERGFFMSGTGATMMTGLPVNCHGNAGTLWLEKEARICSGYALGNGDVWVEHSWGLTPSKQVIETTVERVGYFGFVLNDDESKVFVKQNPPCWDNRYQYVGSCNSSYDDGRLRGNDLPPRIIKKRFFSPSSFPYWTVTDVAEAVENGKPLDEEEFLALVIMPTEIAREVGGDELRYWQDGSNGVALMYDVDTDTYYFFM